MSNINQSSSGYYYNLATNPSLSEVASVLGNMGAEASTSPTFQNLLQSITPGLEDAFDSSAYLSQLSGTTSATTAASVPVATQTSLSYPQTDTYTPTVTSSSIDPELSEMASEFPPNSLQGELAGLFSTFVSDASGLLNSFISLAGGGSTSAVQTVATPTEVSGETSTSSASTIPNDPYSMPDDAYTANVDEQYQSAAMMDPNGLPNGVIPDPYTTAPSDSYLSQLDQSYFTAVDEDPTAPQSTVASNSSGPLIEDINGDLSVNPDPYIPSSTTTPTTEAETVSTSPDSIYNPASPYYNLYNSASSEESV
jgi:hypothetical protein